MTANTEEKKQYISRLKKIFAEEDLGDIEKVAISFKSMWKMGEWHKINLKLDDYEARKMKEDINNQVESMIIEDMKNFKKDKKTFEEWARDSVWSKDTGGPKDAEGTPIRALGGRWKELWRISGSKKYKREKSSIKHKSKKKKSKKKRKYSKKKKNFKKKKHSKKKKY